MNIIIDKININSTFSFGFYLTNTYINVFQAILRFYLLSKVIKIEHNIWRIQNQMFTYQTHISWTKRLIHEMVSELFYDEMVNNLAEKVYL